MWPVVLGGRWGDRDSSANVVNGQLELAVSRHGGVETRGEARRPFLQRVDLGAQREGAGSRRPRSSGHVARATGVSEV